MKGVLEKKGYSAEFSEEQKEQIISDFLPFIKYTAHRLSWRLPSQLTVDDLISVGLMGLMDVLNKFEQGRSKLKTYAEYRIKGAMLDELRAFDNISRSMREKVNELKYAYAKLEKEMGRPPEENEIADALDISLDEYYKILQGASRAITLSFEDFSANTSEEDNLNILDCIPDPNASNPLALLEESNVKDVLARLIAGLPEKEKLLLSLYYWEELTMKEIGKALNLTEGRVCQLHSQAIMRLKGRLTKEHY